jgi:hypothetical protein
VRDLIKQATIQKIINKPEAAVSKPEPSLEQQINQLKLNLSALNLNRSQNQPNIRTQRSDASVGC